ncbi:MAG: adenylate/guanylate cyclase domain-containing protein [Tagaea sp.]
MIGLRRLVSVRVLLPAILGLLVAAAFMPIAMASYWAVSDNTGRLLRDGQEAILDALTDRIASHLDQVASQMDHARRAIEADIAHPDRPEEFARFMAGVMAGTPQVFGIGFLRESGPFLRYERTSLRTIEEPRTQAPLADAIWARAKADPRGWWGPPFVSLILRQPTTLFFQPVTRNGELLGVFMVGIANAEIAEYMANSAEARDIEPFVLAGPERVLIHRNLARFDPARPDLPGIGEVGDPVLARIWIDRRERIVHHPMLTGRAHWTYVEGDAHAYVYREMAGYGPEPWIVGFHESSARSFRARFVVAALFWTIPALLLASMLAAWALARALSARAEAVARHAQALERLEPLGAEVAPLLASPIAEERATGAALAGASNALSRFGAYLPRALVRQLMELGPEAARPATRNVTVLFLDLEGYTAYSEGRDAAEVAAYLNRIFGLVGPAIERHGGTIDKYTGDGLLAVWGIPLPDPDHAAKAVAATRDISDTMSAEHARAPACRVRIGLHTGAVIAGDLGYPGRLNYTVVGRTVNVAQRAQTALRGFDLASPTVIAATETVLAACPGLRATPLPDASAGGFALWRLDP